MIWVTWRQHRDAALIGAIGLALLAPALILTGLRMAADYQQLHLGTCVATVGSTTQPANCANSIGAFQQQYQGLATNFAVLLLLPLLVGVLVGAPLVARELEQGTHLLAWTQGITRQRWLAVKFTCLFGGALLLAAITAALLNWWRAPLDTIQSSLTPLVFDLEGVVPIAYMAFAFALAVASGILLRRTLAAMAVTVLGFLGLRLLLLNVRYTLLPPQTVRYDLFTQPDPAIAQGYGGLVTDRGWMDAQGHIVPDFRVNSACATLDSFAQCTHGHGWLRYVTFQPTERFWALQGIESAIFLALALALIALTVWCVRYRIR
jgi:hypothetical protein